MIVDAGDEGVSAGDAVNETIIAQEIECAVDCDRRRPVVLRRAVDDVVSAERLVTCQQGFQHLPADWGEAWLTCGALLFGMRNRCAGAAVVIVVGSWKDGSRRSLCIRRHVPVICLASRCTS